MRAHLSSALFWMMIALAWCQFDRDSDDEFATATSREGIAPVADPHPFSRPAATHLDDEIRPPEAFGKSDEDLGAVETLNSDPSEAELKRIQDMDEPPSEIFGVPPGKDVLQGLDSNDPRKHHHHHHHHQEEDKPQTHSMHPDGGTEGVAGIASSRGFDSRATVAYDTANKAIAKAQRAAEEAKLAIQAAESAKRVAEQVARRGGDGGPATQEQGLLDIGIGDALESSSQNPTLPDLPPDAGEEDLEIVSSNNDAADLGLPNPNPPSIISRAPKAPIIPRSHSSSSSSPSRSSSDEQLGVVNHAQLEAKATRRQELVKFHEAIVRTSTADSESTPEFSHTNNIKADEGEGDESDFQKQSAHHHHHQHHQHANHVQLMGDSVDD